MSHVPADVYVLLAALVYVGVRRCYPRTIRPERMIVFPVLFLLLGASSLARLLPNATPDAFGAALLAGPLGIGLGWLQAARWALRFDVPAGGTLRVHLPGDPSLLITLLLAFSAEFFVHYAVDSGRPWAATQTFAFTAFAAWGALAGTPIGRAANVLLRSSRAALA